MPNTPAADAFYAQQLAINSDASFMGVTDGARFEFLNVAPLSGVIAASSTANPAQALNGISPFASSQGTETESAALSDQAFVSVASVSHTGLSPSGESGSDLIVEIESEETQDDESVDEAFATLGSGSSFSGLL